MRFVVSRYRLSGRSLPFLLVALLLLGCPPSVDPDPSGPPVGLLGDEVIWPFPSMHLVASDSESATGVRLALPSSEVPAAETAAPLSRMNALDGFSPVGVAALHLPEEDLTLLDLSSTTEISDTVEASSTVQMIDLEQGVRVPILVELDIHPDASDPDRALLIRPQQALRFGARYAVVILQSTGLATPSNFASLREGSPVEGLRHMAAHYEELFNRLLVLGIERDEIALAWDFPVMSEQSCHAPLDAALAAVRGAKPVSDLAPFFRTELFSDSEEGDLLPEAVWRLARGSLEVPWLLGEEGRLPAGPGNSWEPATADAELVILVPGSVRDAAPGSVPLVIFGHGLLADPWNNYLGAADDPSSVQALAERMGAVFVGTRWLGLSSNDLLEAAGVAGDFWRLPDITDGLVQAQTTVDLIARAAAAGGLGGVDVLQSLDGQALIDPHRIYYYGISLGGIQGGVQLANSDVLEHGVLHVGGAAWSTMLERSSDWTAFEIIFEAAIPSPPDRQLLYAMSQLLWDPVDPATHANSLRTVSYLLQESIGDEQVPNLTTELLARSTDLPLLVPSTTRPFGLETVTGDLPPGSRALFQFDSGLELPAPGNRPAAITGAHHAPRHSEPAQAQIEAFFASGAEGTIIHPCGDQPCEI